MIFFCTKRLELSDIALPVPIVISSCFCSSLYFVAELQRPWALSFKGHYTTVDRCKLRPAVKTGTEITPVSGKFLMGADADDAGDAADKWRRNARRHQSMREKISHWLMTSPRHCPYDVVTAIQRQASICLHLSSTQPNTQTPIRTHTRAHTERKTQRRLSDGRTTGRLKVPITSSGIAMIFDWNVLISRFQLSPRNWNLAVASRSLAL